MLPTPDTSHVAYERIYEPAEDSFLFLDTLASASETAFLRDRFFFHHHHHNDAADGKPPPPPPPFVVEIGPGSGVVIAFANAQADVLFGTPRILTAAVDVNVHACRATGETVRKATAAAAAAAASVKRKEGSGNGSDGGIGSGTWLDASRGDLTAPLRDGCVDVLIFNPPYVPTPEMPATPRGNSSGDDGDGEGEGQRSKAAPAGSSSSSTFDADSHLLALSYAGGRDGMETTERLLADLPRVLSARGCAYVLLCAQNRPEEVKRRVVGGEYWGGDGLGWRAETVGSSGKTAGWEKLQIIRIWREMNRL